MKCLLFCCILLIIFRLSALAQQSFGVKGGLNASKQTGAPHKTFAGYQAGIFYRQFLSGRWALASELNFSLTGSRERYITGSTIGQQDPSPYYFHHKFGYLEIPLFLQYHLRPFYAGAGPAISRLLFSRYAHFEHMSGPFNGYKHFDVSGNLLAGCRLFKNLDINVRYSQGMVNMEEGTIAPRKNRFVTLSLSYALYTGKK